MSQIISELNGDNLTPLQLRHRNRMVTELVEFIKSQGCRGCSAAVQQNNLDKVHQLCYAKLQQMYQDTKGWPCPFPVETNP